MEAAPGWRGSDAHGGPPSQMPRPASPPRAESRTQIPSLTSGPIPGPQLFLAAHQMAQRRPLRDLGLGLHGKALAKKKHVFIIKAQTVLWHMTSSLDIYQVG